MYRELVWAPSRQNAIIADESDFGSVDGYECHNVTRHSYLPGYPSPADIELYKLKKRGMSCQYMWFFFARLID